MSTRARAAHRLRQLRFDRVFGQSEPLVQISSDILVERPHGPREEGLFLFIDMLFHQVGQRAQTLVPVVRAKASGLDALDRCL